MALAADESENWSPVNSAKLGQCSLRFRIIAPNVRTRQNDAPACCRELRVGTAVMGGVPFHRYGSSHLCGCYASPVITGAAGVHTAERNCHRLGSDCYKISNFFRNFALKTPKKMMANNNQSLTPNPALRAPQETAEPYLGFEKPNQR
jgi:hypothetical protein